MSAGQAPIIGKREGKHVSFRVRNTNPMPVNDLPEMIALERIIEEHHTDFSVCSHGKVDADGQRFPIYSISIGNPDPAAPAVGFFGGIHGLERIGTQVLLAFLHSLATRLRWDQVLHAQLQSVRLTFMPLVNPAGMSRSTRCNGRGVDLMRNSPVQSGESVPFMLGGQRISRRLPWFRGKEGQPMEIENQAVCRQVQDELLAHDFSIALDCHSGFGLRDRIWFPYACSTTPIRHLPEVWALQALFSETYPNHNYLFEPQSRQYLTHGDLWDHLYLKAAEDERRIFLPLTLEMGSWLWIKKNPMQIFSRTGYFNPIPMHRLQRVLRRHLVWLEFLLLAACGHRRWLPEGPARLESSRRAFDLWYRGAVA